MGSAAGGFPHVPVRFSHLKKNLVFQELRGLWIRDNLMLDLMGEAMILVMGDDSELFFPPGDWLPVVVMQL